MSSHDVTEVYAARDEIDATLIQSMLAESGIEARVVGGQILGAVGEVPAGLPSAPRVWVSEENAESAIALIRKMEEKRRASWLHEQQSEDGSEQPSEALLGKQVATAAVPGVFPGALPGNESDEPPSESEPDDVWECSGCHESVTVEFEICWNCQQPRINNELTDDA